MGAMGSSSKADIALDKQMSSALTNGLKTVGKRQILHETVGPSAYKAAKQGLQAAGRYVWKTFLSSSIEDGITSCIGLGVKEYTKLVVKYYAN